MKTSLDDELLHSIDPGKAGCRMDRESSHACFDFKACFWIEESYLDQELSINFQIVGEPMKPVSRVWLQLLNIDGDSSQRKSSKVEHRLKIKV